jgi:hypothetical protein
MPLLCFFIAMILAWTPDCSAAQIVVRESEYTGFRLTDVRVRQDSTGLLFIKAAIENGTDVSVENVMVFLLARGTDGEVVNRVYAIIKPPLRLDPGEKGFVRISILTRGATLSALEYKVVGLL